MSKLISDYALQFSGRDAVSLRRSIGAYYTPRSLADILSCWAIQKGTERILEPSFGGCELIASVHRRLQALGCEYPFENIIGSDIDPFAFKILTNLSSEKLPENHFHKTDFLSLKPSDFAVSAVDTIIANPPYVRHHAFTGFQRTFAKRLRAEELSILSLKSNLWVYFVLHACKFLKSGGRAAFVLPRSFLDADYAQPVQEYLRQRFGNLRAIIVHERLFQEEGATEGTVIVLAEDHLASIPAQDISLNEVDAIQELPEIILKSIDAQHSKFRDDPKKTPTYNRGRPLADFCQLRIGLVTGDSRYFLFNRAKADAHGLDPFRMRYVVSRSKDLAGLSINRKDLEFEFENGRSVMMLDTSNDQSESVKNYLLLKTPEEISSNATFAKRPIWHDPFDDKIPDAFLSGMSHSSPRLVLNPDRMQCTNSLYRVYFKSGTSVEARMSVALSLTSNYGQFSAEIEGRQYGAGLLKHEPRDAMRIRIFAGNAPAKAIEDTFAAADIALRDRRYSEAAVLADNFLVKFGYISPSELAEIRDSVQKLQKRRQRFSSKTP